MEPASNRRANTFLDEEEELNDKVTPLKKMPETLLNPKQMEDMLASPSINKILEERGCTMLLDGDIRTAKLSQQQQSKKQTTKTASIIPGQAVASKDELIAELKKAEAQGNNQLTASLLETLLARDLNQKDKITYQIQKCNLMLKLGRYNEGQETALNMLSNFESLSDKILFKVLLLLSRCRLEAGEIDSGYADFLRTEGILWDWQAKNVLGEKYEELKDEKDVEQWKDSDIDKDLKSFGELEMMYQMKHSRETNFTHTCYVTGVNIKSYLLGLGEPGSEGIGNQNKTRFKILPEFRNRKVLTVACGEHHTLALVEGDIFNLYDVEDLKKKEKSTFGKPDLFGWGENSCGQLTGYETSKNILKPTIIRYFLGKDIQGVHAYRANSICYDKQGNVYEWGYRPSGIIDVQITHSEKKGILSARLGNQFAALLTNESKVLIKGEIPGVFETSGAYDEINKEGSSLKQIECGNSHIIALTSKGEILVAGKNNMGQLGLGNNVQEAVKFTKIDIPNYISRPDKVFAFKDISAFVGTEKELFMWGAIHEAKSDAKVHWKPFQYELDLGNGISRVAGSGNQIFALDNQGKTYLWDLGASSKFKRYSNDEEIEGFAEISMGKGFQVLLKAFVEPPLCRLEADESQPFVTCKNLFIKSNNMNSQSPEL